jgi:hypothetical protein
MSRKTGSLTCSVTTSTEAAGARVCAAAERVHRGFAHPGLSVLQQRDQRVHDSCTLDLPEFGRDEGSDVPVFVLQCGRCDGDGIVAAHSQQRRGCVGPDVTVLVRARRGA